MTAVEAPAAPVELTLADTAEPDALVLDSIVHRYARSAAPVLSGVDLAVERGEVLALLGPSGCGKTTLLRIIAGLITPTGGSVTMAGREVTTLAPNKRNVGLVHQSFALWPHMTVADNIAFGLEMRRHDRRARAARVDEMLQLVGLEGFARRLPKQLSGGQQQRVALARALAFEPDVLLLDEPLSALDANLRHQLQAHLRHLQRTTGVTTVIVTHDREEAMGVSNRIVVLDRGNVQQIAPAAELYRAPASAFVMRFTGECNLLPGRVDADGRVTVDGFGEVSVAPPGVRSQAVEVGVRPEHVRLVERGGVPARVVDAAFLGPIVTYGVRVDGLDEVIVTRHDAPAAADLLTPGSATQILIPPDSIHTFPQGDPHAPSSATGRRADVDRPSRRRRRMRG